jgi:hypothetical protein
MRRATFKHSGSIGDVLYALAAVRALGGGVFKFDRYSGAWWWGVYGDPVAQAWRLLDRQPYLDLVDWLAPGEPYDYNLDCFREVFAGETWTPSGIHLGRCHGMPLGLSNAAWAEPWLMNVEPKRIARVVLQRTARYRSPYFRWEAFLADHKGEVAFVGMPAEHADFVRRFGYVPHYPTEDLYDVARVVAGCELYAGNQSSPFAIAEGLKKPALLELWPFLPNCLFDRPDVTGRVYYP